MQALRNCVAAGWSPAIGDPGLLGWTTVAVYGAAAIALLLRARRLAGGDRWIWRLSSVLLLVLMVNKQLDLQSALTTIGRCHARIYGWYDHRAAVQLTFIAAILLVFLLLLFAMLTRFRDHLARDPLLWAGHFTLLSFIAIRAAGFHHADRFLGLELGSSLRMNHVLELGALAIYLLAAAMKRRRPRRARLRP